MQLLTDATPGRRAPKTSRLVLGGVVAVICLALSACAVYALARGHAGDNAEPRLTSAEQEQVRETKIDPFAGPHAALDRLDPKLLAAVREAATAAEERGVKKFWITSAWRPASYQQELLDQGIATHGSRERALQWVKTPETSEHVKGQAVDIGPANAAYWMDQHDGEFGLCRTYANEMWHYELRSGAASSEEPTVGVGPLSPWRVPGSPSHASTR